MGRRLVWRTALAGVVLLVGSFVLGQPGHAADVLPLQPDCVEHVEPVRLSSAAEAEARMVGTWIRCRQATRKFVALEGDDIGFEFTADGRFYRIYPDDNGGLIRAEGLAQEGNWQISDPYPAEFEERASLQLHPLGSGYFSDVITFHDDPDAIGIPHAKFHYFLWTGDDPTPGVPAGITEGPCGHPVDFVAVESSAEVEALLTGSWTVCEPNDRAGLLGAGVVGIEFAADGQFWRLVRGADGTIERDESRPDTGWEVLPFDEDMLSWGNAPQLGIVFAGSTMYVPPTFFAEPMFLSLGDFGGGLLKGMPLASEVPLPATGTGSSTTMVAIAGSFLFVGCAVFVLERFHRR